MTSEGFPRGARWPRRWLRATGSAAVGVLMAAGLIVARDWLGLWNPWPSLLRPAAIGFLGILMASYPAVLPAAVLGMALAGWVAWRAGRTAAPGPSGPDRQPVRLAAARGLLLCGSTIVGLGLAEAAAAAWLGWAHRLPAWTTRFASPARPGQEIAIAVIGGSSALGVPYEGWLSLGAIVGHELGRAIPDRRVRVEVLAEMGATLEAMHQKLARLTRRPDVLIVYSGHNEFVTRFSWLHRAAYYTDELSPGRHWDALERLGRGSPLLRLVRENLEKQRVGLIPTRSLGPRETLVGRPVCTPAESAAIVADFHRRLAAIVADCLRIGCLPILIIPPANEVWDPNQSYAAPTTRREEREALFRRLTAIRAREAGDAAGAIAAYREILSRQPTLAEAHYRLARLLEAAGSYAEARRHYLLARDHDGLPMRCITPLEAAYRAVARQAPGTVLVDGPAILRARSRHGLLDARSFHDNVHPTLAAHVALAEAVLGHLKARAAFDWPESTPAPRLDPRRCAAEFGIDAAAWATVCRRTANHLNMLAFVPFDPTERIQLRDRYAVAADRIRAGARPEDVGIPGVGLGAPESGMVSAWESFE